MITVVAGLPVVSGELVRRGPMNFGRDIPGWTTAPYCVHVPTGRLVAVLQPAYDQFLREAQDDAKRFPEDWPELAVLSEEGWPCFADLPATLPSFLAAILEGPLVTDLLDAILPYRDAIPIRFLANTVDHIAVDGGWVALCGRAFQVPVPRLPS